MKPDCILCQPEEETIIKPFEYWNLLVNFKQPYLGSSLLVLKRHVESITDLSDEERHEYWSLASKFEETVKECFGAVRVNHMMLANLVTHVHYHMAPRYSESVTFAGKVWEDKGGMPIMGKERQEDSLLCYIAGYLHGKLDQIDE